MLNVSLSKGLKLLRTEPHEEGGVLTDSSEKLTVFFDRIRLRSHLGQSEFIRKKYRCCSMSLEFCGVSTAHVCISEDDFSAIFHTFKTEVNDELNILGIGEEKTPSKDQLQGAGTNNFTQV